MFVSSSQLKDEAILYGLLFINIVEEWKKEPAVQSYGGARDNEWNNFLRHKIL
jgi:hypothetical protein